MFLQAMDDNDTFFFIFTFGFLPLLPFVINVGLRKKNC